jgi:hypothetical protein
VGNVGVPAKGVGIQWYAGFLKERGFFLAMAKDLVLVGSSGGILAQRLFSVMTEYNEKEPLAVVQPRFKGLNGMQSW